MSDQRKKEKRHKILCILGETARGKDTLSRILQDKYGLRGVVSYTTRPMRQGEVDGREHYFLSENDKETEKFFDNVEIVAYTKIGEYEYFATKEELLKSDIYIIDPVGLDSLKNYINTNKLNISLCAVYVTSSYDIARERAIKRGDNIDIFEKRSDDERIMFGIFDALEKYDYKFTNNGSLEDLDEFAHSIITEVL